MNEPIVKHSKCYVVVQSPESKIIESYNGFAENSYPIADTKGLSDFGTDAFFVDYDWLVNAIW